MRVLVCLFVILFSVAAHSQATEGNAAASTEAAAAAAAAPVAPVAPSGLKLSDLDGVTRAATEAKVAAVASQEAAQQATRELGTIKQDIASKAQESQASVQSLAQDVANKHKELSALVAALEKNGQEVKQEFAQLSSSVSDSVAQLKSQMAEIKQLLQSASDHSKNNQGQNAVESLKRSTDSISEKIQSVTTNLEQVDKKIASVEKGVTGASKQLQDLEQNINSKVAAQLRQISEYVKQSPLDQVIAPVREYSAVAMKWLADNVYPLIKRFETQLIAVFQPIGAKIRNFDAQKTSQDIYASGLVIYKQLFAELSKQIIALTKLDSNVSGIIANSVIALGALIAFIIALKIFRIVLGLVFYILCCCPKKRQRAPAASAAATSAAHSAPAAAAAADGADSDKSHKRAGSSKATPKK